MYLGDRPLAMVVVGRKGTAVYFIHTDHLGTPKLLADESGKVVWEGVYRPFGQVTTSGKVEQPLRFPGQYEDAESGLHYNYFRDYDPGTGTYIESDPIGLSGGINTYAYVLSNPLLNTDPYGLTSFEGFSPSQEAKVRNAIDRAKQKLDDCLECGKGGFPSQEQTSNIKSALDHATVRFNGGLRYCGRVPSENSDGSLAIDVIELGPDAFSPSQCCLLESLLTHEAAHLIQMGGNDPFKLERKCVDPTCQRPPEG